MRQEGLRLHWPRYVVPEAAVPERDKHRAERLGLNTGQERSLRTLPQSCKGSISRQPKRT